MNGVPLDQGLDPSEGPAADAAQPIDATLETLEVEPDPVLVRITDEQAERIF
jgi:hypothetical protein